MKALKASLLLVPVLLLFCTNAFGQFDVTRMLFTPPVVPETQVDPVRFEATVTGNPASVLFTYNGVDRPMFDDGTHGDLVAGDATWTITFTPSEILVKNTADRVSRPVIGSVKLPGSSFNVIGEVWTSAIGLRTVRPIDSAGQETDYVANYVATKSQLLTFDQKVWSQRFYANHGDKYDFIDFVLIGGPRSNRFHFGTKNTVQGIGLTIFDNNSQYGSAGRLQGISTYPISYFFDGADASFSHETGHQWINFLTGTAFAGGSPHWPVGNIAINVMGLSIPGSGAGGTYPWTFTPNGSGGYVVGNVNQIGQSTFNTMELYLMGLIPASQVGTFFVLNNQNQAVAAGQTLQPSEFTNVTVNDVIAARGVRVPDSTQSQKNFRVATVILSEQLLDARAMSFYDFFARRTEGTQQTTCASGLVTVPCNPWSLATGGRSQMVAAIADATPTPTPTPAPTPTPTPTPTPSQVTVSGKVVTSDGRGLRSATVSMTDQLGNIRTATTSSFGFFSFDNVTTGATYTFRIQSRSYRYSSQTVLISGATTLPDFIGLE